MALTILKQGTKFDSIKLAMEKTSVWEWDNRIRRQEKFGGQDRGKRGEERCMGDKRLTSLLNIVPYTDLSTYGEADGVTEKRFYDAGHKCRSSHVIT